MQAAACKEVNALTSPGTLRTLTFTRPKVQWKKPAPASGGLPPIGWRRMFALLQDGDRIMQQALQDPSVCDGLSFMASVMFCLEHMQKQMDGGGGEKTAEKQIQNVVVFGAAASESRVMEKTNYFELLTSKYGCRLVFVGPELKGKPDTAAPKSKFVTKLQDRPFFKVPVPNVAEKFFQYKEKCCGQTFHPENTLVFVFNGGFGNRMNRHGKNLKQPLLHSWLPDLKFLQEKNFVCGFTCADLPHDLVGETIVHSCMLGAKYVLSPMENPYHCASTYVGESSGSSAGSSRDGGPGDYCGNSYVYMTQGRRAAGKAEEKWLSTLLADNKLETTADLQAFFASVDEKFLHGRDVENMTKLPGVATAEKISFPVVEAAPAAATNKEKVGPPSPNVVSSPSSVAGQGSKEAPQQAPVVQGSGGAATSSKSKNKKKKQNAGSSNGDNKNAGAAEAASAAPAKDPTTDVSPPPAPAEGQNAKSSKKKSKAKAVAATPLEEEEPKKEQVLDPAAAEDAPKNITEESGGGGLSKGQKKRLAAKKKKEVSAPPARPAESDDTGEAMKSSIDAAQPAATSNKTAAEGAGAGPAAGGIQRHLEPPLLDIIGLRLEMVTKISPAVTSLQMETSPTDALVSARQARAERILDKINAAGACYFPLPGELAKVGCRLSEVEVSGGRGRARGSGEKEVLVELDGDVSWDLLADGESEVKLNFTKSWSKYLRLSFIPEQAANRGEKIIKVKKAKRKGDVLSLKITLLE